VPRRAWRSRTRTRTEPLSPALRDFLETGQHGPGATLDERLGARGRALERLWRAHRAALLPSWIEAHPGTRPFAWWRCEAPEPARRRLGGVGTPAHEVLAHEPAHDFGIPAYWVTPFLAAYYRGDARDVHGEPIGVEHRGSGFRGVPIDPSSPPTYEAEATYLKRHHLLTRDEAARLGPDVFEPERVLIEEEE
jgi:hypothetical protein